MTKTPMRPRQPPVRFLPARAQPGFNEILADPIVRTLMARDGVGIGDIRYLVALLRDHCRAADAALPPRAPPPAPDARAV